MINKIESFMVQRGEQQHITEPDVSVPPALHITDQAGNIWTLGAFKREPAPRGEFAFDVLCNGLPCGPIASRIERKNSRLRVFTATGWQWLKVAALKPVRAYGVAVRVTDPARAFELLGAGGGVKVTVSRPTGEKLLIFTVDPFKGAIEDLNGSPITCRPGEWLVAHVEPSQLDDVVEVVAVVGEQALRAIPIVTVKEHSHA